MSARRALTVVALAGALFLALASLFFAALGRAPGALFLAMLDGAFGSGYALSETLVKTAPVLLCALGTVLPARLGLISVGAEGQLFMGAIAGTAFVLRFGDAWGRLTLPAMLLAAAAGGAAWGALAGLLRARLRVNETISTLLLNYISPLFVDYLVYGPWKDPQSLGWPATASFPPAATLPTFFETRAHLGLPLGVALVVMTHLTLTRTRWGLYLDWMKSSPALAARAGLRFGRAALAVMALGGAVAGIAGIAHAAAIEGRLQSGVAAGAGYGGFLVAWLARGHLLRLLPLALIVSALDGAGDNLQLYAELPSASSLVLEGLLFTAALMAEGILARRPLALGEVR